MFVSQVIFQLLAATPDITNIKPHRVDPLFVNGFVYYIATAILPVKRFLSYALLFLLHQSLPHQNKGLDC